MVTVFWVRGSETLVTNRPNTEFICSPIRGGGKSSLLEHRGECYLRNGTTILDLFGCYSDDTELFTQEGFKLFKDVTKEDLVATRDDHGFLSFRNPTAIQVYPYKGKMIQIGKSQSSYNLLVTPNHNLYVKEGNNPQTKFIQPNDLQNYIQTHSSHHTPFRIPKTAIWNATRRHYIKITKPVDVDEWKTKIVEFVPIEGYLKVLGWYLSDGNTHLTNGGSRVEITKPNPEKQAEIVTAFLEMGYTAKVYRDKVYVENKQLYDHFKQLGRAHEKYIPEEIKQLPPYQLRILIKTMLKGDGSRDLIYYTSSKRLWDDLVEISIKAGYSVTTYQRPPRKAKMRDGRIIEGNYPEYSVTISNRDEPSIHRDAVYEVDYDGYVYDVTLPPHHTLLVRRKGKIVWSGNSRDGEGLAWLRSPHMKDTTKKIALIHGDGTDVTAPVETIKVSKLKQSDLEDYDILISATPLYPSIAAEYQQVNLITDLVYNRGKGGYKKNVYMIVREASNLYYSRLRIDRNQSNAKAYMIYLIREARHMGLALGLDTLKFTSIDFDIRVLIDYTMFKGQGSIGLPDEYQWLYGFFKPQFVRAMNASQFIILTKQGNLGLGVFPEVKWHKKEKENILKEVGVEVEIGDEEYESRDMTRYQTVDGKTHMIWMEHLASKEMREKYYIDDEETPRLSIRKIAEKFNRSPSTVLEHINKHDSEISKKGYCNVCRSHGGKLYTQTIRETPKK